MDTALAALALIGMVVVASIAFVLGRREARSGTPAAPQSPGSELGQAEIEDLLRTASEFSTSLDLVAVMDRGLALLRRITRADRADLLLSAEDDAPLRHAAWLGTDEPIPPGGKPSPFQRGEGLAGWVMENRQGVIVTDLRSDSRWIPLSDAARAAYSALAAPLIVGGRVLGAVILLSRRMGAFNQKDLGMVSAIAPHIAAAMNNAELYRLIRAQAEQLTHTLSTRQVEASRTGAILESIADGVLVTDGAHQIYLVNPAAERILGIDRQAVLGRPASSLVGLFGPSAGDWAAALHTWADINGNAPAPESLSSRLTLEDGQVVAVQVRPIRRDNGFLGTVSSFRDVTREVEIDRLKSEFVATVSHEMRTPMTSIRGYAELLLMEASGKLNEAQRRSVEIIRMNTERLGRLVADLLDLSKIEAGRVRLAPQPLEAAELLKETQAYLLERCRQQGKPLSVAVEVEAATPAASGDSERMRQVLENAADNAFQFTPAGGSVQLSARAAPEGVEFRMQDSGIGIPGSELPRIFERFFRGERALELGIPGTGLGLPIIRNLVQLQGGEVKVTSSGVPGEGTRLSITLPAYVGREDESQSP